jgi:hypothetical protein
METILIFAVTLIVLDLVALKWGFNSRDSMSESPISLD